MTPALPDLRGLRASEVSEALTAMGEKRFRALQIYRWIHLRGARTFEEMTDLSLALRQRLAERFTLVPLRLAQRLEATDGTLKFRFETHDGRSIEAVYMPEETRHTLCLSSQAGCAMGCAFCVTGTLGLLRNLTPGEIVAQVYEVNRLLIESGHRGPRPLTNLVFMGMGEPLHNYENLRIALDLLQDDEGLRFSHRHVTVSTSGIVPNIERLGRETQVKLALSLNATADETRTTLMPVNKKWNIEALLDACRRFPVAQGRQLTFEYVLLRGINDTDEDGLRLVRLLRGLEAKVNLIPYNANPGLPYEAPLPGRAEALRDLLQSRGLTALIRKSRGQEIAAACGQLAGANQ